MKAVQQHMWGPTPDAAQSQWMTPDWLAERVVRWTGLCAGARAIELGAGDGIFVRHLLASGIYVLAVERDPRFVKVLRNLSAPEVPRGNLKVIEGDVMSTPIAVPGSVDAYIGNPPYEADADIAFVERGLELAPRVVAVLRLVFLAGQKRHERIWSKHHLARIAYLPERPRFIGEKSGSALADFAVFDIRRGPAPVGHRVATEWWAR